MKGRAAYGTIAERCAACFSPEDPVVVFDHTGAAEALRDAAGRASRGEHFFTRPMFAREYTLRADAILPSILTSMTSVDDRRSAFELACSGHLQIGTNNQPLAQVQIYTPATIRLSKAVLDLADAIVVSSQSERRRIQEILQADPSTIVSPLRDTATPVCPESQSKPVREQRDAVTLWAPHGAEAAIGFALALRGMHVRVVIVSPGRPADTSLCEWLPLERAHEALRRARLIVDLNEYGADSAFALSTWDSPIVADVESGTQEWLDATRCYDRRRMGSIYEAVVAGLGAESPRTTTLDTWTPQRRDRSVLLDGPLVSVLIPTYNRPHMLEEALESVQRQSYRNVETIVINDAGDPIEDVVSSYPRARLINMATNLTFAAVNAGFLAASGTYITFLNDDDLFFPHHVATLVTALERSGCAVANANVLTAFLRDDGGRWVGYGLESNMSRAVDMASLLVSNQVGMTSVMFRRSCVTEEYLMDPEIPFFRDYALWLRLATRNDFVHVERITSCYTIRNQGAQQASRMFSDRALAAYQAIYAEFPVANRPALQRRREAVLQSIPRGALGLATQPAAEVRAFAWPFWKSE
jgi:hypothetical protein